MNIRVRVTSVGVTTQQDEQLSMVMQRKTLFDTHSTAIANCDARNRRSVQKHLEVLSDFQSITKSRLTRHNAATNR